MGKLKYIFIIVLLVVVFTISKYLLITHNRALPVKLPKANTVILGDSHARHALNPEYLDNSISLSQDSQNIIYSYYVLIKLLESGNRFHNVFLAYSYHSAGEYYLDLESMEMMRRYHLILDEEFFSELTSTNKQTSAMQLKYYSDFYYFPLGISNDLYELLKMSECNPASYSYIGSFEQNLRAKLLPPLVLSNSLNSSIQFKRQQNRNRNYLNDTLQRHYYNPEGSKQSPVFTCYLEKLANLCQINNIALYLINTPVHPEYKKRIPSPTVNSVDNTASALETKYPVVYLNYSDLRLDDTLFYDYDHLTTQGSIVFSKQLNKIISFINTGEYSYTP
jgi:hypothetical protein